MHEPRQSRWAGSDSCNCPIIGKLAMKCNGKISLQSSGKSWNKLFGCLHLTGLRRGTNPLVTSCACCLARHLCTAMICTALRTPKVTSRAVERNKVSPDFVGIASAIAGFSDIFCRHVL